MRGKDRRGERRCGEDQRVEEKFQQSGLVCLDVIPHRGDEGISRRANGAPEVPAVRVEACDVDMLDGEAHACDAVAALGVGWGGVGWGGVGWGGVGWEIGRAHV